MTRNSQQPETSLVKSHHLDKLLRLTGEVIVASSNQGLAYRHLLHLRDRSERIDIDSIDTARDLAETTSIISSELHELVQAIRTVSLRDFAFRAKRLVRETARRTGKRIKFEFEGEETTVDKSIVEKIYDPIAHQLRNAVDHGIEDALTRKRAGKSEVGRVVLRAYNTERETFIEIEDDGQGIDLAAMRQRAISLGHIDQGADFTEEDALHLMCMPGFSTSTSVSETSGRGVGMDVVFSHISELGGTLSFSTEPGKGSTFTFRVPLVTAVNIVDALVVRSGEFLLAIPIANVVATSSIQPNEITTTMGQGTSIMYLGNLLPLHNLAKVLRSEEVENKEDRERISILIIEHKTTRIAFEVSELHSPQKLVIIPFEGKMSVPGLAGTTILGGKQLGFIVDTPSLLDLVTGSGKRLNSELARRLKSENGEKEDQEEQQEGDESPSQTDGSSLLKEGRAENLQGTEEFIVETIRLLPQLNEAVFRLEADGLNDEFLNTAFRLLHTIKGNLVMAGRPRASATVHAVEEVLDTVRAEITPFTPEVVDVLMDGVSFIEETTREKNEDKADDELMERAAKLVPVKEDIGPVSKSDGTVHLTSEATYRRTILRKEGIPFYQCHIEFDSGLQPPFLVACLIYRRFCEFADVLGTAPALPDIERGAIDHKLKLLFATKVEPDLFEKPLREILTTYFGVTRLDVARFT